MIELPHTGIIDETLEGEEELLMRARLHVEGGLSRFSEGMTADAIAAFYDAISSAMQRYILLDGVDHHLSMSDDDDVSKDDVLFKVLLNSNVFDTDTTQEDFDFIKQTLEDAFENKLDSFDETSFLEISENLLIQLGIIKDGLLK